MKLTEDIIIKMNNVLDNVDWELIHRVMTFCDWVWYTGLSKDDKCVPTVFRIRNEAGKFLQECVTHVSKKQPCYRVASGGLEAKAHYYKEDNTLDLNIKFILEDWDDEVELPTKKHWWSKKV